MKTFIVKNTTYDVDLRTVISKSKRTKGSKERYLLEQKQSANVRGNPL